MPHNAGRQLRRWQPSGGWRTWGTRQLPGNARAADRWSAGALGGRASVKVAGGRVATRPERFAG